MYVASIHIRNFRCFDDTTVEFNPGVNVIIGENNAGKTALLRALGLVFDREHRPRLKKYDFYQGIKLSSDPRETTHSRSGCATR
jgi:putative ATP-dependent endonuclease of OLD family